MKSIQFTKEALFDIEEITLWYEDQREGLSFDFELCLEVGVNEIQRTPSAFQKRYKDVKIRFISSHNIFIFYHNYKKIAVSSPLELEVLESI